MDGRLVGRRIRRDADRMAEEMRWLERVSEALLAGRPVPGRPVAPRTAPNDERALRGIPMIGGTQGGIPGTLPHRNRKLDR